jgi:hypothetical protein
MLFEAVPYIHLNGTMASGKSVISKTLERVAFNPMASIGQTAASVFRTIHSERGLFFFEEFESASNVKTSSESMQMMYQILNAGYGKESASVPRMADDGQGTLFFDVFCPKVFISISTINRTLQSRCISLRTKPRSKERDLEATYVDLTELKDQARYFENKLRVWSLSKTKDINRYYREIRNDTRYKRVLINRNMQLYAPLLAILKSVGDPLRIEPAILDYIRGEITKTMLAVEQNPDEKILRIVARIIKRCQDEPFYGAELAYAQSVKGEVTVCQQLFYNEIKAQCVQENLPDHALLTNYKLSKSVKMKGFVRDSTRLASGFETLFSRKGVTVYVCKKQGYARYKTSTIDIIGITSYLDEFDKDLEQYAKLHETPENDTITDSSELL